MDCKVYWSACHMNRWIEVHSWKTHDTGTRNCWTIIISKAHDSGNKRTDAWTNDLLTLIESFPINATPSILNVTWLKFKSLLQCLSEALGRMIRCRIRNVAKLVTPAIWITEIRSHSWNISSRWKCETCVFVSLLC